MRRHVTLLIALVVMGLCLFGWSTGGTVILSDDFSSGAAGASLSTQPLNNALGGSVSTVWSGNIGSVYSSTGDVQSTTWGMYFATGYNLVPGASYVLEADMLPPSGSDGTWPFWSVLEIGCLDTNDPWHNPNITIRLTSPDGVGDGIPYSNAVWFDYCCTGEGELSAGYHGNLTSNTIDAGDWVGGYLPVRVEFGGGLGTVASPYSLDVYINDNFKWHKTITDLAVGGNAGLVGFGSFAWQTDEEGVYDPTEEAHIDNFKLTLVDTPVIDWCLY